MKHVVRAAVAAILALFTFAWPSATAAQRVTPSWSLALGNDLGVGLLASPGTQPNQTIGLDAGYSIADAHTVYLDFHWTGRLARGKPAFMGAGIGYAVETDCRDKVAGSCSNYVHTRYSSGQCYDDSLLSCDMSGYVRVFGVLLFQDRDNDITWGVKAGYPSRFSVLAAFPIR